MMQDEKDRYILMLQTYQDSFETTLEKVALQMGEDATDLRTNGFWKRFKSWTKKTWRKVRSVIVSTAIGVASGFAAGGPVGAIIGGIIGLTGSIIDLAANDVCHFAMQCPKGWMQDCSSGDCIERDSWNVSHGAGASSPSLSNPNPGGSDEQIEQLLQKWYNQKEDLPHCPGNGRCEDVRGSLTFDKLDQLARSKGVYSQIQTRFSYLSAAERWIKYKQRLGRIFEDAVLRSLFRPKNTKTFYESDFGVNGTIPDAILETGKPEEQPSITGGTEKHYFWWDEGAFIDAKISQSNHIAFSPSYNPQQLSRMINILAANDNAETATNFFSTIIGWGAKIKKNAATSGCAMLHLITPGETDIDDAVRAAADAKKVYLWHSECDVIDGNLLKVRSAKVLNNSITIIYKADTSGHPVAFDWSKQ